MIHRVVYGSIERFLGILIEHFAGKFPLWLAPVQAMFLPINDKLVPFARETAYRFEQAGIRTKIDDRSESLNKKVRDAQLKKIPLIITIGGREKDAGTLSVRTLDGKVRQGLPVDGFIAAVRSNVEKRSLDIDIFDKAQP